MKYFDVYIGGECYDNELYAMATGMSRDVKEFQEIIYDCSMRSSDCRYIDLESVIVGDMKLYANYDYNGIRRHYVVCADDVEGARDIIKNEYQETIWNLIRLDGVVLK